MTATAGARVVRVGLIALLATVALAALAHAQDAVPEDNSSVDQYSESLPSSQGDRVGGVGRSRRGQPLPGSVARRLPAGAAGELQRRVATDTGLGAPALNGGGGAGGGSAGGGAGGGSAGGQGSGSGAVRGVRAAQDPSLLSAVGDAFFGRAALWPLLILMAGVVLLGLGLARRRAGRRDAL